MYTNEQIHAAILAAADLIERDPGIYNFWRYRLRKSPGEQACLLGLIGECLGMPQGTVNLDVVAAMGMPFIGRTLHPFYVRLDELVGAGYRNPPGLPVTAENRRLAVKGLRLYVDTYHPLLEQRDPACEKFIQSLAMESETADVE